MIQNMIELKNVTLRREKTILREVNWQVKRGEHWAILGLNGSGKTTILNIVNGYLWPTEGEVWVLGEKFGTIDLRELRKKIGWVSSSFQERIYGYEKAKNIVVSGKFASIGLYEEPSADDYAYALHVMEQLGCPHLYDRVYQTCSQGEKQKILICRALMSRPELLILDEPCNGLDFISREQLLQSIDRLSQLDNAPTFIFVTHHIEEITPVYTHVLLLRDGTVFQSGTTQATLTKETLSEFFRVPLEIHENRGRYGLGLI